MAQHQYFVLTRTLWQNDTWKPVACLTTRKAAEVRANELGNNGWTPNGTDHTKVLHTWVLSKTAMKRKLGISYDDAMDMVIAAHEEAEYRKEVAQFEDYDYSSIKPNPC